MKFVFETTYLNTNLYKKLIKKNLFFQFTDRHRRREFFKWLKSRNYTFIIRPSKMASQDLFFSKNGVGGITDPHKTVLYLNDELAIPEDSIYRALRSNANVISHENGHLKGIWNGNSNKTSLRNTDESGHPAGTPLAQYVQEVHDRDIENKSFRLNLWTWNWKKFKIHRYRLQVIDFRDIFENN